LWGLLELKKAQLGEVEHKSCGREQKSESFVARQFSTERWVVARPIKEETAKAEEDWLVLD